ncbi:MAG: hypothetical protein JWR12_583 [Mucilaginibacter sp.]|nr:hypothetical protein [Mucilaginibacter sp.]
MSVICTLYEGHYHYGVAALVNSLYKYGFRGDIYIGYKGELPPWAKSAKNNDLPGWNGVHTLIIEPGLNLHFLSLTTDVHFANYKPEFMLDIWNKCLIQDNTTGIFYFDPDIVIKCDWTFYEKWITYGVALVHEIVWNDMPYNHPKRHQWLSIAEELGYKVVNKLESYINSGFVGVNKNQMDFLRMWRELTDFSSTRYGYDKRKFFHSENNTEMFRAGDQDLLNLTAMCTSVPISEFGPEGMDFVGGGWLMSHSTGSPKPWKINYIGEWVKGNRPTLAVKEYWKNANGIINCYPGSFIKRKLFYQKFVSILARFYNK